MTTAKTILDNIMTRIGMYSAISNYFTSTEIHAQEVIRLLNALLKELTASVNFKEMLEPFDIYSYKEWKSNEVLSQGDIRYVLGNTMDGNKYEVVQGGVSTTNPAETSSKKGDTFTTSDGLVWRNDGDWCEYDLLKYISDYKSISINTLVDFDRRLPLTGITDEQWQYNRMYQIKSYNGYYQLRGTRLYLFPGYLQNTHISGFYYSSKPVLDANNVRQAQITSQNDNILLPDLLVELGVAYKWLMQKNLAGWEDVKRTYDDLLGTYVSLSKTSKRIRLSGEPVNTLTMNSAYPQVIISDQ